VKHCNSFNQIQLLRHFSAIVMIYAYGKAKFFTFSNYITQQHFCSHWFRTKLVVCGFYRPYFYVHNISKFTPQGNMIFKIQKRMIRIIMNVDSRTSCRSLFKQLGILPLKSQCIYSLMSFVSTNRELFVNNADIHNFPTRSQKDLHLPIANLSVFKKECISLVLKSIIIFPRG
jgi:hypothetical protein